MRESADLLIGIDSGTSVVKAVAFDLAGRQIAAAAVRNRYDAGPEGVCDATAGADLEPIASQAIRALADKVEGLARRTAAVAVTAQGDGTWLVGAGKRAGRRTPGSGSTRARRPRSRG